MNQKLLSMLSNKNCFQACSCFGLSNPPFPICSYLCAHLCAFVTGTSSSSTTTQPKLTQSTPQGQATGQFILSFVFYFLILFLFIIRVERQTQKWHRTILAKTIFCVDFAKFCNFVFIGKKAFHSILQVQLQPQQLQAQLLHPQQPQAQQELQVRKFQMEQQLHMLPS